MLLAIPIGKSKMSITLPGYKVTAAIHEGVNTVIYRSVKNPDQIPVIIKTLKAEYPTIEELTRLRHEYKILQQLDLEGIVKAYA